MSDPKASTMASPPAAEHHFKRVAILFAGGPAPAANAVISTAATAFLRHGIEVVGVLNGYSHLVVYGPDHPLQEGRDSLMKTAVKLEHPAGRDLRWLTEDFIYHMPYLGSIIKDYNASQYFR